MAKGGFYHAGQVYVFVLRVYAHRSIVHAIAERLASLAKNTIVGDPASDKTDVGPLIRHTEVDRVEAWVNEALQDKATLKAGGERLLEALYAPTVLLNTPEHSKVSQREIFGPAICVYVFDTIDEAIDRADALPYAFQAAIATQAIDTALYAYKQLAASTVLINDHTAFRVDCKIIWLSSFLQASRSRRPRSESSATNGSLLKVIRKYTEIFQGLEYCKLKQLSATRLKQPNRQIKL